MSFEVKLPLFEGPFDLLLFFIERDELDIYDIPISQITNDFLDYIHRLEEMNIEVASEFILVAATLMRIKAKLLLPRPSLDEEGNEIDPREELVQHLLEYKKYKSVVVELADMEAKRSQLEHRGNIVTEIKKLSETTNVEAELQHIDLYKLLKVYQKVLKRFEQQQNKPSHQVIQFPFTMDQKKSYIMDLVRQKQKIAFSRIIELEPDRIAVIFNFLAILELLQLNQLNINIGLGFNNFWIEEIKEKV
ncbi:MAG: segregation and condensation protein A [Candidatus Cyclobacteriaceae bacterium M3_2C_046]